MEKIEQAVEQDETSDEPSQGKYFYIIVGVIIILFFAVFLYAKFTADEPPKTVEDLHILNLAGKLNQEQGYMHNGFSFVTFDGLWYTNVEWGGNNYKIPLHFGPRELTNVTFNGTLNGSFNAGEGVYLIINPLAKNSDFNALTASELAQNLAVAIKRLPIGACDRNETETCYSRPIISCKNTDKAAVYLVQEPGPSVEYSSSCIILRGEEYDLVKAADWLLLKWYGVIKSN